MHIGKKSRMWALAMVAVAVGSLATVALIANDDQPPETGPACENFGPQTPRDIDNKHGENKQTFQTARDYKEMNLCNIHFHNGAEHKSRAFAMESTAGEHGHGGGLACAISKSLSQAEMKKPAQEICKGLKPGDTIEVHWVHTSCKVKPGKGLGSCMSASCANPELRVESQVFTLVNDPTAMKFGDFGYGGNIVNGFHQARGIPSNTGIPVQFMGSTTGPKYNDHICSPLQVTWSVRPECAKLDINSLGAWCAQNEFEEDHGHGVRPLIVNPKLLAPIK